MTSDADPLTPPQIIPRPSTARPGDPGPWEALDPDTRVGLDLKRVLGAFASANQVGPVPAAFLDADAAWSEVYDTDPPGGMSAAVLIALFEEEGECRVVLTRRDSALRAHRGEVSFPGGRIDPGETPEIAALREASEEVGLDPKLVVTEGWLHPVLTFISGSLILPVVGTCAVRPELVASPAEVERVFDVSLAQLLEPGTFHEERWSIPGRRVRATGDDSFPVRFFEAAGEMIWGATARMLFELLSLVLELPIPPR